MQGWRKACVGVAAPALLVAIALAASSAQAAAPLPADLVALEQQMAQLQANSARFTFQEELSLGELLGEGAPLLLVITGKGESSDSPPQATFAGGPFGTVQERIRVIGSTAYRFRRDAAEIDGGRPWVRGRVTPTSSGNPLDPGGLMENDAGGRQATFSKFVQELNGALSVHESGPVVVDDQRVVEFDAELDPAPFLAQLESRSGPTRDPFSSLGELPSAGGKGKPTAPPKLELEAFIAPNGLPVRARVTFSAEGVTVALRIDTLAINVPVVVTPPPASQTIDEAQLLKLERARAARELKRALRACARFHGKRAVHCRARARARSRVHGSEPSLF
jgi:hypothetical protein